MAVPCLSRAARYLLTVPVTDLQVQGMLAYLQIHGMFVRELVFIAEERRQRREEAVEQGGGFGQLPSAGSWGAQRLQR